MKKNVCNAIIEIYNKRRTKYDWLKRLFKKDRIENAAEIKEIVNVEIKITR